MSLVCFPGRRAVLLPLLAACLVDLAAGCGQIGAPGEVMESENGASQASGGAQRDAAYEMTPAGLVHRDCIVELQSDAVVDDSGLVENPDGTRFQLTPCAHPSLSTKELSASASSLSSTAAVGQAADAGTRDPYLRQDPYSFGETSDWVSRMVVDISVPSKPSNTKGSVAFFPSLKSPELTEMSPVLSWGGASYWRISAWYIWGGNALSSPLARVEEGDTVRTVMESSDCRSDGTHCTWKISMRSRNDKTTTSLKVVSYSRFTKIYGGVLETYDLTSCDTLPASGSIDFSGLRVFGPSGERLESPVPKTFSNRLCQSQVSVTPSATRMTWIPR